MNLHKHQLYLLEQHSELFKSWSAIIRINTEGKSSIMILGPDRHSGSKNEVFTTQRFCEWQHRKNRWQIVAALRILVV